MFIVGKSFFNETLSKLNIKPIAPLFNIHIPYKMLVVGPENTKMCKRFFMVPILILSYVMLY